MICVGLEEQSKVLRPASDCRAHFFNGYLELADVNPRNHIKIPIRAIVSYYPLPVGRGY
jgi:hypothetical protein